MTTTIAFAGKGGVGKTTLAALAIRHLVQSQPGSILAIDADPSSNLNMVLGLELGWTVGESREGLLTQVKSSLTAGGAAMGTLPGGMTKRDFLDYEVRTSLAEGERFDLIAMGRSEGPGCYCAVNHNLRQVIDSISKNYRYVVIDNEAGMEHLSRRTTKDVEHLLIVTDPTLRGLAAAERIGGFRHELDIHIENVYLVLNRLVGELPEPLRERIEAMDLEFVGAVAEDPLLGEFEWSGRPLVGLPDDSATCLAVGGILDRLLS